MKTAARSHDSYDRYGEIKPDSSGLDPRISINVDRAELSRVSGATDARVKPEQWALKPGAFDLPLPQADVT